MIKLSLLGLFVPTFFFVSATPGLCMTLALSLGMTIGVRRTLWMMAGELIGVAVVALATLAGVATVMLAHPEIFVVFKLVGGAYLAFLGIQLWKSRGAMAIKQGTSRPDLMTRTQLATQGFVTAIANPKGWAFFLALLPPFIDYQLPITNQIIILLSLILIIEFICLIAYASGGRLLGGFLKKRSNVNLINRIAGSLIIGVAIWLSLS
ncbi:MAG: threonine transporter RhtB [Gammaproteobacteria bacterium]|nr:threonine transporter RhtB [Gammaproteobacteria bacterium]